MRWDGADMGWGTAPIWIEHAMMMRGREDIAWMLVEASRIAAASHTPPPCHSALKDPAASISILPAAARGTHTHGLPCDTASPACVSLSLSLSHTHPFVATTGGGTPSACYGGPAQAPTAVGIHTNTNTRISLLSLSLSPLTLDSPLTHPGRIKRERADIGIGQGRIAVKAA